MEHHLDCSIPDGIITEHFCIPQRGERGVDMLFVLDNSPSMTNEQENLQARFIVMMEDLKNMESGLPDIHIGVVTPDLGTGNISDIPGCTRFMGDNGIMGRVGEMDRGEICIGPNQRYIVDIEPKGCRIERDPALKSHCLSSDCHQEQCDLMAKSENILTLTYVEGSDKP